MGSQKPEGSCGGKNLFPHISKSRNGNSWGALGWGESSVFPSVFRQSTIFLLGKVGASSSVYLVHGYGSKSQNSSLMWKTQRQTDALRDDSTLNSISLHRARVFSSRVLPGEHFIPSSRHFYGMKEQEFLALGWGGCGGREMEATCWGRDHFQRQKLHKEEAKVFL